MIAWSIGKKNWRFDQYGLSELAGADDFVSQNLNLFSIPPNRTSRIDISGRIVGRFGREFDTQTMDGLRSSRRWFRVGEMSTARIEAFSDGVFSIVITLLILSIQVPQIDGRDLAAALSESLVTMAPKFLSYALSFAILCVWWVAHHHLFASLVKSDRGLLWLNSLFLFWLASVPFPTALLGRYPNQKIAVVFYGAVMALAGLSFSSMRFYTFYVGELILPDLDRTLLRRAMIKSALNPLLHLIALLMAWVNIRLSLVLYVAIPLMFFLPTRLERLTFSNDTGRGGG